MYVFHYDAATGAYLGGAPCDFDQQAPGEPLVPAWASKTPPPLGSLDQPGRWPFYVAERDDWEVRDLPPPPEPEPEPAALPPPSIDDLQASINAHLTAAQSLLDQLKAGEKTE